MTQEEIDALAESLRPLPTGELTPRARILAHRLFDFDLKNMSYGGAYLSKVRLVQDFGRHPTVTPCCGLPLPNPDGWGRVGRSSRDDELRCVYCLAVLRRRVVNEQPCWLVVQDMGNIGFSSSLTSNVVFSRFGETLSPVMSTGRILGDHTSPRVFAINQRLLVVRGIQEISHNGCLDFAFSVCEDGAQRHAFFHDYESATRRMHETLTAIRRLANYELYMSKVSRSFGQDQSISLPDFCAVFSFLFRRDVRAMIDALSVPPTFSYEQPLDSLVSLFSPLRYGQSLCSAIRQAMAVNEVTSSFDPAEWYYANQSLFSAADSDEQAANNPLYDIEHAATGQRFRRFDVT